MAEKNKTTKDTKKNAPKKTAKPKMTKEEKEAAKLKEAEKQEKLRKQKLLKSEIWAIVIIALGVFFVLSNHTNACGMVGISVSKFLKGCFGKVAYILPFFMIVLGVLVFAQKTAFISLRLLICSILFFICLSSVFAAHLIPLKGAESYSISFSQLKDIYQSGSASGGVIGVLFGSLMLNSIGSVGLHIVSIVGMIIMLLFIIDTPLSQLFDNLKIKALARKEAREEARAEREKYEEEQLKIDEAKMIEERRKSEENKSSKELPTLNTKAIKNFEEENTDDEVKSEDAIPEVEFEEVAEVASEPVFREYEGDDITENKRQILDYVSGDAFNNDEIKSSGFGLDMPSDEPEEKEDILVKYGATIAPGTEKSDDLAKAIEENIQKPLDVDKYKMPPINLLRKGGSSKGSSSDSSLNEMARVLESTLRSFNVDATVSNYVKGPAVTRFEVTPAPGVQVAKITRLQDDLALNLRATSLRIEAPIPGKSAVGIEVSNETTSMVTLRELIESKEYKASKSKIAVTLGKSISGENIICDLHEMPHILIGGTTGSGKSVCIDSMLVSLLYKARPDEVKLLLIDPKVVELTPFDGIPHLVVPVVTEPNKAAVALAWAVNEMNERYNKFAEIGVKDLAGYNESVKFNGELDKVMPEMVIVIDELADLIMAAKNAVEDSICRLAQKARAAGMHLVIATQRPSTDIITGVIKANVPSRIALSVSSGIDSRVILDMTGAENLLGKGDMLYMPQSLSKPIRVQGTFVSDEEVHKVIDFVKSQGNGDYDQDVMNQMAKVGTNNVGSDSSESSDGDELFMDALETVVKAEQCSVSMLQRRFRIGYNRAARLVDMMEERGIVGPQDGSRPRKVNMTPEELDEYIQRNKELDGEF